MKAKRPDELKEEFSKDWEKLGLADMCKKYGVCKKLLRRWAKEFGLKYPKPQTSNPYQYIESPSKEIKVLIDTTLQRVQNSGTLPDGNTIELQQMAQQLKDVTNGTLTQREKEDKLCEIAMKMYAHYTTMSVIPANIMQEVDNMVKAILYKKRVGKETQEETEMSEEELRAMKRTFNREMMLDVKSYLNNTENKFFDMLMDKATKRALQKRKEKQEATQRQAMKDGVIDAEVTER